MSVPVYREANNGSTVHETAGGRFCVELVENATTGYTWDRPDFDETLLALESDESIAPAGGAVGAGGAHRFFFTVKAAGSSTVRLAYRRAWASNSAPAARFELTIVAAA